MKYTNKKYAGKRYGRWTLKKRLIKTDGKHHKTDFWIAECDCGTIKEVRGVALRNGGSKSCGCLQAELNTERYSLDLEGRRLGHIVVLNQVPRLNRHRGSWWECKCLNCGKVWETRRTTLIDNKATSCGCIGTEKLIERSKLQVGEKNPTWRADLTDEDRLVRRNTYENREWIKSVMTRDDYTCQVTGRRGGELAAHHIESWNSNKGLRYESSNGETVNKEIHKEFHLKYGRGNNTAKQWEEFKELFIKQ